jgi:hypothetical protein
MAMTTTAVAKGIPTRHTLSRRFSPSALHPDRSSRNEPALRRTRATLHQRPRGCKAPQPVGIGLYAASAPVADSAWNAVIGVGGSVLGALITVLVPLVRKADQAGDAIADALVGKPLDSLQGPLKGVAADSASALALSIAIASRDPAQIAATLTAIARVQARGDERFIKDDESEPR